MDSDRRSKTFIILGRSPRAAVATIADNKKSENERKNFMVGFLDNCICDRSLSTQSGSFL